MRLVSVYKKGKPTDQALELLYNLMAERDGSVNISHRHMPTKDQHIKFVESRPYRFWMLVVVEEEPVGAVYLTHMNEIGVFILDAHKGKGYGMQAVSMLLGERKPLPAIPGKRNGHFLANVSPKNEHSKRLFQRLGFTQISETYELS